MAKKKFDLDKYRQTVLKKIQANFGEPVDPDWSTQMVQWRKLVDGFVPRGFMYVFDVRTERMVISHGMDSIGYEKGELLNSDQLLDMLHQNHRFLLGIQIYQFHNALFAFKKEIVRFNFYSVGLRAIKDKSGKYWLSCYTQMPFQYDTNGYLVRYLSWHHIIVPYNGEALQTQFFHKEGQQDHPFMELINEQVLRFKRKQLELLGFSEKQQAVIRLHALRKQNPKIDILKVMNISQSTLNDHHSALLKNAKKFFPENSFRRYEDVIDYLIGQGLVHIDES